MSPPERASVLRWRADLAALVVEDEASYLVSELEVLSMEGPLVDALVAHVDGTFDLEGIVEALRGQFEEDRVRTAIDTLCAQGLIVSSTTPASAEAAYYEASGAGADAALAALDAARVGVLDLTGNAASALLDALEASGVTTCAASAPGLDLEVVLVDDYLAPELRELNLDRLDRGIPWLLARPRGRVVWSGPLLVPGETACWACLAHRLEQNRQGHVYLASRLDVAGAVAGPAVFHPGGDALAAGLLSLMVTRRLAGLGVACEVRTDDLVSGESARHPVIRRPQCPSCGDATLLGRRGLDPVHFASRPKVSWESGGHRAASAATMLSRYGDQVSPLTGIATSLTEAPMPHDALHVVISGQNVARRPNSLEALRHGLRSSSCGKGTTERQARASALGEAIERCSGVFQGDEPTRESSLDELGDEAVDPRACMLFSERQYELRSIWNAGAAQFNFVFEPFDDHARLEWSPTWSLTEGRTRWLPTQYLYYGYDFGDQPVVAYADSNGCAAGTSIEDAALQGTCELIERDAVAIWWYNRLRRPGIDLASMRDPYVDRLCEIYLGLGREVWALDLTSDLGVPVVGAFSRAISGETEDLLIAFGAHLDPRTAALRALTEMNQFLTSVLPEFGGGPPYYSGDAAFAAWCQSATVARHAHLAADPAVAPRDLAAWPSLAVGDLRDDLTTCVGRIEGKGMEVLVLDQTRPDVGLPVVKVLAPGMRHFWPRFAPGRLYDVPVELGWLERATPEEELNTVGVFI